jgi:diadenosine tetraphosphate (Ap4A) HIT family hydrolase
MGVRDMQRDATAGAAAGFAFALDPRLAADTHWCGRLPLSHLLLMNDATFPWLVLVPARVGVKEIFALSAADRAALMEEIAAASAALAETFEADKINVGALGNLVPQLHVHIVARRIGDPAWPGPVWGAAPPRPYAPAAAEARIAAVCARLAGRIAIDAGGA